MRDSIGVVVSGTQFYTRQNRHVTGPENTVSRLPKDGNIFRQIEPVGCLIGERIHHKKVILAYEFPANKFAA